MSRSLEVYEPESLLLSRIDHMREELNLLREAIASEIRRFKQKEEAYKRAITGRVEYVNAAEAARMIGVHRSTLSEGRGGTECLKQRAIRLGDGDRAPVRFRRQWVIRHIEIRDSIGLCDGTCCDEDEKILKFRK